MTQKLAIVLLSNFLGLSAFAQSDRNCGYDQVVESAYLSCVACGIKDVVGRTPSFKYLSLLAASTNQLTELDYKNPSKRKNNNIAANLNARETFYQMMAEQIQAYGFCMDKKIDANGNVTVNKGYGHLTRGEWNQVTPLIVNSAKANKSMLKAAAKTYGFKDGENFGEMFSYSNWSTLTPKQRQAQFRQKLNLALKPDLSGGESPQSAIINLADSNGEGLQDCLNQIDRLQTRKGSMFQFESGDKTERGVTLCKSIANSCGLTDSKFCEGPVVASSTTAPSSSGNRPTTAKPSEPAYNLFEGTKSKGAK
ncbi:MAG: hypothetical protein ACLGGX_10470 [Bdellovibrionia bacterium]